MVNTFRIESMLLMEDNVDKRCGISHRCWQEATTWFMSVVYMFIKSFGGKLNIESCSTRNGKTKQKYKENPQTHREKVSNFE